MNKVIALLSALLLSIQVFSQLEIVKDTMYFYYDPEGQLFVNGYREFDDGSRQALPALGNAFRLPVPDTITAINYFLNQSLSIADQYSYAVVTLPKLSQTNATIDALSQTILNLFAFNIRDTIQKALKIRFINSDASWTLLTSSGSEAIKFVEVGAQKALRLERANGTRLPVVIYSEKWFRVLNLDGKNREFFLLPNGVYAVFDENGRQQYRLKNNLAKQRNRQK